MVFVTLLWSTAGVLTRHLDAARSFEVTFWRSGFNALALAAVLTALRGPALWRGLFSLPREVWISALCWSIMFTAFMVAITLTTVANVLVMMALGPLVTALFARLFLRHRLPVHTWAAIGFGGLGIVWMFGQQTNSSTSMLGSLVAMAVPLAAAVNFTVLQHVGRNAKNPTADTAPPHDMLPAIMIGAAISALGTLPLAWPLQASAHDLRLLALLGAFQLALPCLLLVRLSRELSAPEIALLGLLEVVFGVAWAWLWADEQPAASTLSGGILVIGALIINELLALRRRRTDAAENPCR